MVGKRLSYLCSAILFVFAASSAISAIAYMYSYQAERFEQYWESEGFVPSGKQWNKAYSHLSSSLGLSPEHPDYLQSLGRLYSWSFFLRGGDVDVARSNFGVELYRLAIAKRPYWASGWSEFALLKAQLGEVDEEFWQAYTAAIRVGPWEPSVIVNLLNAGTVVWSDLSWLQRTVVIGLFRRISTYDPDVVKRSLAVVDRRGMGGAFCYDVLRSLPNSYMAIECQSLQIR